MSINRFPQRVVVKEFLIIIDILCQRFSIWGDTLTLLGADIPDGSHCNIFYGETAHPGGDVDNPVRLRGSGRRWSGRLCRDRVGALHHQQGQQRRGKHAFRADGLGKGKAADVPS